MLPDTVLYSCYIDDLIFIVDERMGSLDSFLEYLNRNYMNLHFTGHVDKHRMSFPDVSLNAEDNGVSTDL